jgi:hypothetical protein
MVFLYPALHYFWTAACDSRDHNVIALFGAVFFTRIPRADPNPWFLNAVILHITFCCLFQSLTSWAHQACPVVRRGIPEFLFLPVALHSKRQKEKMTCKSPHQTNDGMNSLPSRGLRTAQEPMKSTTNVRSLQLGRLRGRPSRCAGRPQNRSSSRRALGNRAKVTRLTTTTTTSASKRRPCRAVCRGCPDITLK